METYVSVAKTLMTFLIGVCIWSLLPLPWLGALAARFLAAYPRTDQEYMLMIMRSSHFSQVLAFLLFFAFVQLLLGMLIMQYVLLFSRLGADRVPLLGRIRLYTARQQMQDIANEGVSPAELHRLVDGLDARNKEFAARP